MPTFDSPCVDCLKLRRRNASDFDQSGHQEGSNMSSGIAQPKMDLVVGGLAEFLATFFFIILGAGTVVVTGAITGGDLDISRLLVISLAHGIAIMLLVAATANISGGHINPAVTIS